MGLLSFAQSVGASLFGSSAHAAAGPEELKKEAAKHGLDTSGIEVHVDGDHVKISGTAATTADAEKIALAMGNTIGVKTLENNIQVKAEAPAAVMYTVKSGDTLSKIAEANYGHGHAGKYPQIFEANKPMLSDPDKIYPGQVLRIPAMT